MFALPTFEGLRLSLSEVTRLYYSDSPPENETQYIESVKLNNEKIDIDVKLTQGLNVVIGESSSGKTLFVDSLYKKIVNNSENSNYAEEFKTKEMIVENPNNTAPHYIEQNFIVGVIDNKEHLKKIEDIEIIKKVFPSNHSTQAKVDFKLNQFRDDIIKLFECVENIELAESNLKKINNLFNLININKPEINIIDSLTILEEEVNKIKLDDLEYDSFKITASKLNRYLSDNPLIKHDTKIIDNILNQIELAYKYSNKESKVNSAIENGRNKINLYLEEKNKISFSKDKDFKDLLRYIKDYIRNYKIFEVKLNELSKYKIEQKTNPVKSMRHKLYIENRLILNKEKVRQEFNYFLRKEFEINNFNDIQPENLYKEKWKGNLAVKNYHDFGRRVCDKFSELNTVIYKITTREGDDYYTLSPGRKASVILDLILGFKGDRAPLIIDQPEDNLSSGYINKGLVESIKKLKLNKQIIIVSHNATIPMIGDAQNIILCKNTGKKIIIRSNRLEEKIDNVSMVDYIAKITDGGKSSIKKRLKKYNIKKYND
jgi:hypothetical protein